MLGQPPLLLEPHCISALAPKPGPAAWMSMWTFFSWVLVNFLLFFKWYESYLPAEIGLWKDVLICSVFAPALSSQSSLVGRGPSQRFRLCELSVPGSTDVTI